jgi:uncharacterized protein YeaO (DUF488 family)
MIRVHRVYDRDTIPRGERFLVDRLWPRGVKKEDLKLAAWMKESAPSDDLRQWYAHDPEKWSEFQKRYFAELDSRPESWQPLAHAARRADVVLLYSSKETALNNAVALKMYLEGKSKK